MKELKLKMWLLEKKKIVSQFIYGQVMKIKLILKQRSYTESTANTYYDRQYQKFQTIERWVLNCSLGKSNVSTELITWNVVCSRLVGLKSFIDTVITQPELNVILHNQIDNILNSPDFQAIYLENYNKQSHGKEQRNNILV